MTDRTVRRTGDKQTGEQQQKEGIVTGMTRNQRLAATFVDVVDQLVGDYDVIDLLQWLSARCTEILDVPAAGMMLADARGGLHTTAASDERSSLLGLFGVQYNEGPCADCHITGRRIGPVDLAVASARWPQFAPLALSAGFRGTYAFPLRLRGRAIGALNLFLADPGPLPEGRLRIAQAFADTATVTVLQQHFQHQSELVAVQMQAALTSRIIVEQAKGVLAERWSTTVDEAAVLLRGYAREHGIGLSVLARGVVEGRVDTEAIRQGR